MTVISEKTALQYLVNVRDEFYFDCCDGTVLRRMSELAEALERMSESTFAYHVRNGKNDFSDWVFDAVGDAKLAKDLIALQSCQQFAGRVRRRVEFLRRKLDRSYAISTLK